jgi:hypothetical protein
VIEMVERTDLIKKTPKGVKNKHKDILTNRNKR